MLTSIAAAQLQPAKRHVCYQRCVSGDADNPKKAQHQARLKKILASKDAETDPAKRKEWESAERDELDRHQDELENMCRKICASLPEE